ncbi:MAG: hypothetical protein WAV51_04370 [Microgenomates group bacterium]
MESTQTITITRIFPNVGEHPTNAVSDFQSEFACIMHGASLSYGYVAAALAADTAVWGYKEIRKRHCYWIDKKALLTRIIRTTNISLWQKRKEKIYSKGLVVDGVCCIIGQKTAWIGCFGDASVVEIRKNQEQRLMGIVADMEYEAMPKLGSDRYALTFASATFPFTSGDTLLFAVGSLASLPREEIVSFLNESKKAVLPSTTGSVLLLQNGCYSK